MNHALRKRKIKRLKRMALGLVLFFLFVIAVCSGSYLAWSKWMASTRNSDSPIAFKPVTYSTNMPEFSQDLDVFFASFKQLAFASDEAREAQNEFLQQHQEIRTMKMLPNYLTGDLNIRIEARRPVSEVIIDGTKMYLAEDATIIPRAVGDMPAIPFEVMLSTTDISQHLPEFIELLGERQSTLPKGISVLSCGSGEESCELTLSDGSKVEWGTIFYASRKLEELAHLLEMAASDEASQNEGILQIDMRYAVSSGRSYYKRVPRNGEHSGTI